MSDGGHTPLMGNNELAVARELSLRGAHPPVKVPGYEQEQFLGHGAYGEVWVATNRNSGRKVAIKFYTRRAGLDWSSLAREVEKLRYLFSDRYVVQLFEVGWESDPPYYVMEYMENGSLEDMLRQGPLSVHDAVGYFREIAVALVHAHNKGILHCDLKPANILLDHDRRPRLADFGQSRLTNEMSPALGTLFYMAPEQADLSATPDARWDVYALGAVMYRMLTGEPPHYQGERLSTGNLEAQLTAYRKLILHAPKPDKHRKVPGMDAELAGIIDRCLETSPSKRYPNPQAVVDDLDAWRLRRVRRPILVFTGIGFAILLVMMMIVGTYIFRTSVNTARRGVIERALEGNRFAARTEARQIGMQIQLRWLYLEGAARDPDIRRLIARWPELRNDPKAEKEAGMALDAILAGRRGRSDQQFDEANRSSLWFVDDAAGFQRGTDPPHEENRHVYRGYRDYFHGLGRELEDKTGPAKAILSGPHRSMVYQRGTSGEWSAAFSVPIWADPTSPGKKAIGVIGLTIDLKSKTRIAGDRERFAVMIDTRPDASGRRGAIVRHPYLEDTTTNTQPVYCEDVVKWVDSRTPEFAPEEVYRDPVGGAFDGFWLASVERVIVRPEEGTPVDTGWVILVQERKEEVLDPVTDLEWRLRSGGAIAGGFLLLVIVVVWMGTVSVLDAAPKSRMSRLLRRWAGLPTATVGSVSMAGTLGTGISTGNSTPRAGAKSPAPGTLTQDQAGESNSDPTVDATPRP